MKAKEETASYLVKSKKFTYQDYLDLPNDGKRYEVMKGELIMAPAPNTIHQTISNNLEDELRSFLKKQKLGKIFHVPYDVIFSETDVVQPDILVILIERLGNITENYLDGAPDLIIEILSPKTAHYVLLEKKELYERSGVKEYWIVDPRRLRVMIYVNQGNRFELNQRQETKGMVKSLILTSFATSLENTFFMD
ncbi:MAG: Uma2 family endonuclease [bacterium]|nr:MAG: Uma2 family endonuclease [bacterium]